MKSDKNQSMMLIGFGLILLSGICIYISLSQPRISNTVENPNAYITDSVYENNENKVNSSENSADIISNSNSQNNTLSNTTKSYTQKTATTKKTTEKSTEKPVNYPLNLNTATVQELMTINGIGETRASMIISYREHLGGYTSVDEIKNISGIGEGIYEQVSPYLTV